MTQFRIYSSGGGRVPTVPLDTSAPTNTIPTMELLGQFLLSRIGGPKLAIHILINTLKRAQLHLNSFTRFTGNICSASNGCLGTLAICTRKAFIN